MLKTSNKLVGAIFNKDLYVEDEGVGGIEEVADLRNEKIDFESHLPAKRKELGQVFRKLNSLKGQTKVGGEFGIIDTMNRELSLNELAAKGVHLSLREKLVQSALQ
mmetsp:Transcript_43107/g.31489  ORF Transcript_43107/g.31489 Transcript_43107/m.31489 type:complete len:106 (+) Transcript_43107:433-750(+)